MDKSITPGPRPAGGCRAEPEKKRVPLPKRFNAALSEDAYERLRALNAEYGLGNNDLLTVLLENLDRVVDADEMDRVYREFIAEYGAPAPPSG